MKYRIFAGMNNEYHGIYEFSTEGEAMQYAWNKSLENLESYGGFHGYPHPNNYDIDEGELSDEKRWEMFLDDAESWLQYDIAEVIDGVNYDEEGEPIDG